MKLRLTALGLAGFIIVLDRLSKMWIESSVKLWSSFNVIPGFFDIVHTQNKGMAFGLFADSTSEFRTFLLVGVSGVVLVFIAILIWRLPKDAMHAPWASTLALGLIFGGAIGNQFDRIARGSVTDFLDVYAGNHHWPAFNVADSAITVGAILMAVTMLRSPDPKKQA
jgi:signal peptidase II